MVEKNTVVKKTTSPYFSSLLFLALVLSLTWGLSYYNSALQNEAWELQNNIEKFDISIAELESDEKIIISSLLAGNKKTIDSLTTRSNITKIIAHLDTIQKKYNIKFEGFKLSSGKIETKALVESDESGIAYQRIAHFIQDYRDDESGLFELSFINQVAWSGNSIKFNVSLLLK